MSQDTNTVFKLKGYGEDREVVISEVNLKALQIGARIIIQDEEGGKEYWMKSLDTYMSLTKGNAFMTMGLPVLTVEKA